MTDVENKRRAGGRFYFGSYLNLICGFALTILLYFGARLLEGGRFNYLYELICERSPAMYLLFVLTFCVMIPLAIETRTAKHATMSSLLVLCFASLSPFLLGMVASIMNLSSAHTDFADTLAGVSALEDLPLILKDYATAQGVAWDSALLGLVLTIQLLFVSFNLMRRKSEQRADDKDLSNVMEGRAPSRP